MVFYMTTENQCDMKALMLLFTEILQNGYKENTKIYMHIKLLYTSLSKTLWIIFFKVVLLIHLFAHFILNRWMFAPMCMILLF